MLLQQDKLAVVWGEQAVSLARWAHEHLLNRRDGWRSYLPPRKQVADCRTQLHEGQISQKQLLAHFTATKPQHLVCLPSVGDDGYARWFAVEVDRFSGDRQVTPGTNFHAVLHWHDKLCDLGFSPLLEDVDGQGSYRLLTLLDEAAPVADVLAFTQRLVADYADHELYEPPRLLPGKAADEAEDETDWLRLPGRHPVREHYSRIWDGSAWLSGASAIAGILAARVTSPSFLQLTRRKSLRLTSTQPYDAEAATPIDLPEPTFAVRRLKPKLTAAEPTVAVAEAGQLQCDTPPTAKDAASPAAQAVSIAAQTDEALTERRVALPVDNNRRSAPDQDAPRPADRSAGTQENGIAMEQTPPAQHTACTHPPQPSIDAIVQSVAQRTGLRESEVQRRVFEWFNEQDEVIQAVVLGQIPQALRPNIAKLLAEKLA